MEANQRDKPLSPKAARKGISPDRLDHEVPLSPRAKEACDRLVKAGCHPGILETLRSRSELAAGLRLCKRGELSSLRDDIHALRQRLRRFQKTLDGMSVFLVSNRRAADLRPLPDLLRMLEEYVLGRMACSRLSQTEGHDYCRAQLTAYVLTATGKPHDAAVARLLAHRGDEPSADAVKMFRKHNTDLIEQAKLDVADYPVRPVRPGK